MLKMLIVLFFSQMVWAVPVTDSALPSYLVTTDMEAVTSANPLYVFSVSGSTLAAQASQTAILSSILTSSVSVASSVSGVALASNQSLEINQLVSAVTQLTAVVSNTLGIYQRLASPLAVSGAVLVQNSGFNVNNFPATQATSATGTTQVSGTMFVQNIVTTSATGITPISGTVSLNEPIKMSGVSSSGAEISIGSTASGSMKTSQDGDAINGTVVHANGTATTADATIPASSTAYISFILCENRAALTGLRISFDGGTTHKTIDPGVTFTWDKVRAGIKDFVLDTAAGSAAYECIIQRDTE